VSFRHCIDQHLVSWLIKSFQVSQHAIGVDFQSIPSQFDLVGPYNDRERPANPFLSASVAWSLVSSGFQMPPEKVVHEQTGVVGA
jgi:hypothetical protein